MAEKAGPVGPEREAEPLKLAETAVESVAEVRTLSGHSTDGDVRNRCPVLLRVRILPQIVTSVRQSWQDLRSVPIGYRASQLRSLRKMIEDNATRFEEAVWKDLRKVKG